MSEACRKRKAPSSASQRGSKRRGGRTTPTNMPQEVVEIDDASNEGDGGTSVEATTVQAWQDEADNISGVSNGGQTRQPEDDEGERGGEGGEGIGGDDDEGEEDEEEQGEEERKDDSRRDEDMEREDDQDSMDTEVDIPVEYTALATDVMHCARAVRASQCSNASIKGMQSLAARRRVQEMLSCVESGVVDSFISALAGLHDTDDDFERAVKDNVRDLAIVQVKLTIQIAEPPDKPAAMSFAPLTQLPAADDPAQKRPEIRFTGATDQGHHLLASYKTLAEQEKKVMNYSSNFEGEIKAAILDYEFRLKASREEVNQAIQHVKNAEGAKRVAEEMIEKALPPITDAISRSDDDDDTSRRGVGMVPLTRGVNTVPARAIGHVLDFLDAEENRELREQRNHAVKEVKRARDLLNQKRSYCKLGGVCEMVVRQITGYAKHQLRQRVRNFISASETAKQTLLSSLKELMRVQASLLEVVISHHEEVKAKAQALRRSAEEYGQTTDPGDLNQLQCTINSAKATIRNSDRGINECMEANKLLWDKMVTVLLKPSAEELWETFDSAMCNCTVSAVYNELLRSYDPPFPRLTPDHGVDIEVVRHGKALSATNSTPARSEREEVDVEDEEHYDEEGGGGEEEEEEEEEEEDEEGEEGEEGMMEEDEEERKTPAPSPSSARAGASSIALVPHTVAGTPQSQRGGDRMEVSTVTQVLVVEERQEIMTINQDGASTGEGEPRPDTPGSVLTDLPSPSGALPHSATTITATTAMDSDELGAAQEEQARMRLEDRAETCKMM